MISVVKQGELWGAVWKNIIYRCDSVFVAYLSNFLSNLYIGYINFIISDKMFYKHDKKQLQNKLDISHCDISALLYWTKCISKTTKNDQKINLIYQICKSDISALLYWTKCILKITKNR